MSLLTTRGYFYPYLYPFAFEYFKKQQYYAFWTPEEINLSSDINDWKLHLTEAEKRLIGQTLKGFTQAETLVGDYWATKVARWFKHDEIQMMAHAFSAYEGVHADSYSRLNITLGLDDFKSFSQEPATKAKLERLILTKGKSKKEIATSLAIFSAFTEGVSLFSSFAILLNFSRFNKMNGMGQIINMSIRDESLHSKAGCQLFNTFIGENPEIWTDELKKDIYDGARLTVLLEDNFLDDAFSLGDVEGLAKDDLKQYIRHRANTKLGDLGLKTNWKNVDKEAVIRISTWMDVLSAGVEQKDFFSGRPTGYSHGTAQFTHETVFEE